MTPLPPKKRFVFVSHAGEDTWVARQIAEKIKACGADVFLDSEVIEIGEKFDDRIQEAFDVSDEFLVLLTPWALKRPYVIAEIGAAWAKKIQRVIIVTHGVTPKSLQRHPSLMVFVKTRNMITLNQIDRYFDELRKRVVSDEGQ